MPALAAAGFHVLAPDQRGYGRTTGGMAATTETSARSGSSTWWEDAASLLSALQIGQAHVVGHDFGSPVAAYAALIQPDVFRSVVLMSAPFGGPPSVLPSAEIHRRAGQPRQKALPVVLLDARGGCGHARLPAGHRGLPARLLSLQSADWKATRPTSLKSWNAPELAKLPTYYVMALDTNMAGDRRTGDAETRGRVADRRGAGRVCRDVPQDRVPGRTAVVPVRHRTRLHRRVDRAFEVDPSMCRRCSSPAPPIGASTRCPAHSSACSARPARRCGAATFSRARGTGSSREQPEAVARLLLDFLKT